MKEKFIFCLILFTGLPFLSFCQKSANFKKNEIAVLFGLNQPLLAGGFNIELNYFRPKLAFDYSHGVSLEFSGPAVVGKMKEQKLVAHLPFTTGFGVGYRLTKFLNFRAEPKWHRFEIYYDGESQTKANQISAYTTFTLGFGLYGKWHPFKNRENMLQNIMIAPSIRWWPNVYSSLTDNQFSYSNKITNQTEIHKALNIGFLNTPFFFNISIGYRF